MNKHNFVQYRQLKVFKRRNTFHKAEYWLKKHTIQPWTNEWSTLNKIKHTFFNGNFNLDGATIYLSEQDN